MRKLLPILLLCVFAACSSGKVYKHFIKMPSYMWEKDHKLNFKVDIKEKLQHVNVLLAIRYDHFCPHDDIKVKVTTIQPNGQESTDDFTILLKKNGKHQGEAAANLWDLEVPITKNTNLDQIGTYEYVVENLVNEARIIAIVDVGLIIEKVEE